MEPPSPAPPATRSASACDGVRAGGADDAVDGVAPALVARPAAPRRSPRCCAARPPRPHRRAARARHQDRLGRCRPTRARRAARHSSALDRVLDHAAGDLIVDGAGGHAARRPAGRRRPAGSGCARRPCPAPRRRHRSPPTPRPAPAASAPRATWSSASPSCAPTAWSPGRRQGGQERGRLRPRQAPRGSFGTLAVVTEGVPAAPAAGGAAAGSPRPSTTPAGPRPRRRRCCTRQVVPAAVEVDWPADGAGTLAVLLEGMAAGVAAARAARPRRCSARRRLDADEPAGWWATRGPVAAGDDRRSS